MKPEKSFVIDFRGKQKFILGEKPLQPHLTSDTSELHLRFYGFDWPFLWLVWVRKGLKHPLRTLCLSLLRTHNFVVWCFVVRAPSTNVSWRHWSPSTGHPSSTDVALALAQDSWFGRGLPRTDYMTQGLKWWGSLEPWALSWLTPAATKIGNSEEKNPVINPAIEYVKRVESKEGFTTNRF